MQMFNCPWCGPRPQIEFSYLRAAESVPKHSGNDATDTHGELDRIYLRSNPMGLQEEIWQHTFGCRGWLRILRNNLTHEVDACVCATAERSP